MLLFVVAGVGGGDGACGSFHTRVDSIIFQTHTPLTRNIIKKTNSIAEFCVIVIETVLKHRQTNTLQTWLGSLGGIGRREWVARGWLSSNIHPILSRNVAAAETTTPIHPINTHTHTHTHSHSHS